MITITLMCPGGDCVQYDNAEADYEINEATGEIRFTASAGGDDGPRTVRVVSNLKYLIEIEAHG